MYFLLVCKHFLPHHSQSISICYCSYLELGSEYFGLGDEDSLEEVITGSNHGSNKWKKQNRGKGTSEEIFIFYFNFSHREEEAELWSLFENLLNYMKDTKQCRCVMVSSVYENSTAWGG